MIDINLVPPDLRKKKKGGIMPQGFSIPLEIVVGSAGGLLMLLIVIHVILLFVNISKLAQHKSLNGQWEAILPEKEKVDEVISDMRKLQDDYKAIENITEANDISWSHKLNILSDVLPRGVWLKKIALNEEMFFIEGSAISRIGNEMINAHVLVAELKKQDKFLENLLDLELSSIQRRKISKVDIADFLITTKLDKPKEK